MLYLLERDIWEFNFIHQRLVKRLDLYALNNFILCIVTVYYSCQGVHKNFKNENPSTPLGCADFQLVKKVLFRKDVLDGGRICFSFIRLK